MQRPGDPSREDGERRRRQPVFFTSSLAARDSERSKPWLVARRGGEVPEPEPAVERLFPQTGGDLPQYIYPSVAPDERSRVNPAEGRKADPNLKDSDVWAWLPPPLIHEGQKVQSNWLHDFLLNPYPIRPAVVLRMPKFNMSSEEASKLVNYFAAMDEAEYPYESDSRTQNHAQLRPAEVRRF